MLLKFEQILFKDKVIKDATIELDQHNFIKNISRNSSKEIHKKYSGTLIPGLPNTHSHAFQFTMAGESEYVPSESNKDNFWTWREKMYDLALNIEPVELLNIATTLYKLMREKGFSHVVEFHYLLAVINGKTRHDGN